MGLNGTVDRSLTAILWVLIYGMASVLVVSILLGWPRFVLLDRAGVFFPSGTWVALLLIAINVAGPAAVCWLMITLPL